MPRSQGQGTVPARRTRAGNVARKTRRTPAGYWSWYAVVNIAVPEEPPDQAENMNFYWGRDLVKSRQLAQVEVELSGRIATAHAWIVPHVFFFKGEDNILSKGDSAREDFAWDVPA